MTKLYICGDLLNSVTNNNFFDLNMLEIIENSNYSIVNFEAPLEVFSEPVLKAGPHKKQKKETVSILKNNGFDLMLLANNHILDYGRNGLQSTLNECQKISLSTLGAEMSISKAYEPLVVSINGLTFGFINASESQFGTLTSDQDIPGYAYIYHPRINENILALKNREDVDFIIFFAHAGLEHYDIPLIEWRNRYKELCNLGVDCVIGSHPHIPQGYEEYNGKLIFYSLGNYYFPKLCDADKKDFGFSLQLEFQKNQPVSYNIIYHTVHNNMISRINQKDSPIDFVNLNDKLKDENYKELIDSVYLDAYEQICYPYFATVFNAIMKKDSFLTKLKKIVRQILYNDKNLQNREVLLYHLLNNDTYRFITQRAIRIRRRF